MGMVIYEEQIGRYLKGDLGEELSEMSAKAIDITQKRAGNDVGGNAPKLDAKYRNFGEYSTGYMRLKDKPYRMDMEEAILSMVDLRWKQDKKVAAISARFGLSDIDSRSGKKRLWAIGR